jgi:[glutamine synthetase] adenylyltransferase / [glutamine synthetase]-adenylyl-L-tyrosine phosphorylase
MGKLGAFELNYSSDVDLIVFYDPEKLAAPEPTACARRWCADPRARCRASGRAPADGYVFRTDLRLRPDPGSTPVAVSTDAALPTTRASARTGSAPR